MRVRIYLPEADRKKIVDAEEPGEEKSIAICGKNLYQKNEETFISIDHFSKWSATKTSNTVETKSVKELVGDTLRYLEYFNSLEQIWTPHLRVKILQI